MSSPPNLQPANTLSADPLAALKDIHAPLEPGLWPPSWEFWLVITTVLALGVLTYYIYRKIKGPPWYTEASKLINSQFKALEKNPTNANILGLNRALKRIALSLHPRDEVAHLHGHTWCQWLNKQGHCNHFTQGIGLCLGTPAYSHEAALDATSVPLLKKIVLDWLQTQKSATTEEARQSKLHLLLCKIKRLKIKPTPTSIMTFFKTKILKMNSANPIEEQKTRSNQQDQTTGERS